jgi:vacuolar-type H+-ATPase subunit D/Vma8
MVEKYTKSELIRLRKELKALANSQRLLEERKKELYRLFRSMLKELSSREADYNAQLGRVRDSILGIAGQHSYMEIADDASIQPQAVCTVSSQAYMKGVFFEGGKVEYPDLKGQFVSPTLKRSFLAEFSLLVTDGIAMDSLVKKAVIAREEMRAVSRKLGYIQTILIPRVEGNIRTIEHIFEERRRDELIKVKKFKGKDKR